MHKNTVSSSLYHYSKRYLSTIWEGCDISTAQKINNEHLSVINKISWQFLCLSPQREQLWSYFWYGSVRRVVT